MLKPALAAAVAMTLIGVASVPAWCQESAKVQPASTPPSYDAVVMPAPQEVQMQLASVGQRIEDAERASFYSPSAESDYLQAERMYKIGYYDEAAEEAQAAANALPDIPNLKVVKVLAHKD